MSKTVIILGAGASAKAGGPLMNDFLDAAEKVKPGECYPPGRDADAAIVAFEIVFKALGSLRAAHAKSKIDTQNIESVFAAFEMAVLLETPLDLKPEEMADLNLAMAQVIQDTLETSVLFPYGDHGGYLPPKPYQEFAELIQKCDPRQLAIITFNYDICLDYAFYFNRMLPNYILDDPLGHEKIKLLKLHGSLNWYRCVNCQKIVAFAIDRIAREAPWFPRQPDEYNFRIGPRVRRLGHCTHNQDDSLEGPVIVPPTSNKLVHYKELKAVWVQAANELATAENVLVFGYSLPPSDYFFRYLYALGSIGPARPKRFFVFDPDRTGVVEQRFRDLLGPETSGRFRIEPLLFEDAIRVVREQRWLL
jgi:hypothetical protein